MRISDWSSDVCSSDLGALASFLELIRPAGVVASITSSSRRASSAASTGVLPRRTLCAGPRTDAAGFVGMTWPVTRQSTRSSEERRVGQESLSRLDVGGRGNINNKKKYI